jgi:hypothetical protein
MSRARVLADMGASGSTKITRIEIPPKALANDGTIPRDNTLPLITEGAQAFQHDFTPTKTTSTIIVEVYLVLGEVANVGNSYMAALFINDTCVNVRAMTGMSNDGNGDNGVYYMSAEVNNTDGSAIDIEIRADGVTSLHVNPQLLSTGNSQNFTAGSSSFGGATSTNCTHMMIAEI